MPDKFTERLKQANLASKNAIANFIKKRVWSQTKKMKYISYFK